MSDEKKIEVEVAIDADAETVWRALTDGEELSRWFPLDARVKPGVGGSLWLSWGEGADWEAPIEVWEPNKHLRTVDTFEAQRIAVDYYIESRGGETVLRLVHSGFGDDTWQGEIDSLDAGWTTFLQNLKHYLEHHRGEPRTLAYFRHPKTALSRDEAFRRTMTALGFPAELDLRVDDRYATTTSSGDRFEGVVKVFRPPINFTATVKNWSDGFVLVEIEGGRETCRPAVWVSLYGDAGRDAEALGVRVRALLERAFA
ncbi:MAG TPA: SRPBCC domain-containing protein [Thermoanaerobaculia bacterium]|nr:SRPBCC domain-containing protein [Thermoanaerobaculia bacterium]